MEFRVFRRLVLAASLGALVWSAGLAHATDGDPRDGPERVAAEWAKELMYQILHGHVERGTGLALGLNPAKFRGLNERQLRTLHNWLIEALRAETSDSFRLTDPELFADVSRVMEGSGDAAWFERYLQLVRKAQAQIFITCQGRSGRGEVKVQCSAFDVGDDGRAIAKHSASFPEEWINRLPDYRWALGYIAGAIVRKMEGVGKLETVLIVDEAGRPSKLSRETARILGARVDAELSNWTGLRAIGRDSSKAVYRVEGTLLQRSDRYALSAELIAPEGDRERFFEEFERNAYLDEFPGGGTAPPQGACGTDADVGKRPIGLGRTLDDWVFLADNRMKSGDHERLIDEANTHLRDHCGWALVAEIREKAVEGLADGLDEKVGLDPRSGLKELARVEALVGSHRALMRVRARAHALLGERREEEQAYRDWLKVAGDHPERRAVLLAQERILDQLASEEEERALGLDGRSRRLVRLGLSFLGHDAGSGPGAFDGPFRVALREWQSANGHAPTGYLKRRQAENLIAEGQALEMAESVEASLGLTHGERVLVQRGLSSLGEDVGVANGVFDGPTRAGIRSYQEKKGLPETGYLTGELRDALVVLGEAPRAEEVPRERKRVEEARDILTEAVRAARGVEKEYNRAKAFARIAGAQTKAGDARGAAQSRSDARAAARGVDESLREWSFPDIAEVQAKAEDIQGALETARMVEGEDGRAKAFGHIAVAQAKAGDIRGALETTRMVEGEDYRAWAFGHIAVAQAKAGDIRGALETSQGVEHVQMNIWSFGHIAKAQAEAGDARGAAQSLSDARATARGEQGYWRARAFLHLAVAQTRAGDTQGALATARMVGVEYKSARGSAFAYIAAAQAEAGDARGAAQSLSDARAAARGVEDESDHASIFADIARAQAKAGDIQGALATARGVKSEYSRVLAFADIARAQAKAGDIQGAKLTARYGVLAVEVESNRAVGAVVAVNVQAKAGDIQGALATARLVKGEYGRALAFADIAEVLVTLANDASSASKQ